MVKIERIGILTGGGDAPGLNAVIRSAAKKAILRHGWKVLGIGDSMDGLLTKPEKNCWLDYSAVSGILQKGGTILGTTNRGDPFNYPFIENGKTFFKDVSDLMIENVKKLKLDALIVIGGDGSMRIAYKFFQKGVQIVGIPKTIDNDLLVTDATFGFETAVDTVTECLDRLHSIAESRDRVVVVEVMGRDAGWIALHSGIAGGADVILIPEIPYDVTAIVRKIENRKSHNARFTIIVIAEGAKSKGGETSYLPEETPGGMKRLGGAGEQLVQSLKKYVDSDVPLTVLGHLQRGGSPSSYDRVLATRFGAAAIDLIAAGKFGRIVCLSGSKITSAPIEEAIKGQKLIPADYDMLQVARDIGISLGE